MFTVKFLFFVVVAIVGYLWYTKWRKNSIRTEYLKDPIPVYSEMFITSSTPDEILKEIVRSPQELARLKEDLQKNGPRIIPVKLK